MKTLARFAPAFLFALPAFAHAATSVVVGADSNGNWFFGIGSGSSCFGGSICTVAQTILYLINDVAVPLLFAIAFIVLLWGIANAYILSGGDPEKVSQGHKLILWGIIGFAVMISLWGLVNVVSSSFGLSGYSAPPLPNSYGPGF